MSIGGMPMTGQGSPGGGGGLMGLGGGKGLFGLGGGQWNPAAKGATPMQPLSVPQSSTSPNAQPQTFTAGQVPSFTPSNQGNPYMPSSVNSAPISTSNANPLFGSAVAGTATDDDAKKKALAALFTGYSNGG